MNHYLATCDYCAATCSTDAPCVPHGWIGVEINHGDTTRPHTKQSYCPKCATLIYLALGVPMDARGGLHRRALVTMEAAA